ncbi:MAG: class I adenylate-forming enzyme family protein [Armatimonadota bacterium]
MSENLAAAFAYRAARSPERVAMRWDRGERTYEALWEATVRRATVLRTVGLRPGDRVAVTLPNGPDYIEIVLAVAHADLVLVPLDPRLTDAEVDRRLEHAGCRALVGPGGLRVMADRDVAPLQAWAIAYTSGSTGEPKGAVLSHRAKLFSALIEAQEYGTTVESVVLINTPLFHVHALVHAFTVLLRGGCVSVARRFDPEDALRTITAHGVTEVSMVPAMYRDILDAKPDLATLTRLRVARCTGAAMPADLREAVVDRFGHCLHVLYGATEAGGISNLRPADVARKPGSVGRPFLGVDLEVRDGILHMMSPCQFSGYHHGAHHRPGEDWLTLNDLARFDEEGFLYLQGRADDVIISGGENIQPAEVEAELRQHPAVADVAVVGIADARLGQVVTAYVVVRAGHSLDVDTHLEGRLARFKHPRQILFVPSIPRNAMGKVDRTALQRLGS